MERLTDEQRETAARYAYLAAVCAKRFVIRHRMTNRNCDHVFSAAGLAVLGAVASYRPGRGSTLKTWMNAKVPLLMVDHLRGEVGRAGGGKWREARAESLSVYRSSSFGDDGEESREEVAAALQAPLASPLDALELSEMWDRAERILPARLLQLVRHVYRDGLTITDVARMWGCTQGLVSNLIRRALDLLGATEEDGLISLEKRYGRAGLAERRRRCLEREGAT
jgi:RNA polymerase sigma factor (sigma-70 family)